MSDVAERVKKIVVEHLGVEPEKVVDKASFIDDLGADSLDIVELVMAFEEEFGVEIPGRRRRDDFDGRRRREVPRDSQDGLNRLVAARGAAGLPPRARNAPLLKNNFFSESDPCAE